MFAGLIITNGAASLVGRNFATVEEAKTRLAEHVNTPTTLFKIGYECHVIDRTTHQVVSFAEVPLPKLEWQDAK